ncbi:Rne/Rng family ribonuclease [Thermaurantiacus sp.]
MTTRMLIDARHPEETRVAVVRGNRIDEFDFEAASRKQIKGNIYLAKVTRVEPSLQAAFIDYGGNRHGFLAFSEIHPDYYQIPREDREALLREEQKLVDEAGASDPGDEEEASGDDQGGDNGNGAPEDHGGAEDAAAEALRSRRMQLRRRYKIQDVIRRRQVMLVQVVKEERGNKGAALTTYISLAGRYGVLMPNTAQGGGISRKIANAADRKRLKAVIAELKLPSSMGAIIRTAGLSRTKTEIRRDFDYLTRLWDEIRERTLASTAPALVYEDNDLLKRAIRDIYTREIDEVLVDGEAGYRQARAYMKLLMPSHARKIQLYADPVPLFLRAGVEGQLAAMMNPVVQLKSGGYMVISPTEALVAVDVNSGRATREHNIEETALRTNIEAAEEIARQLRLRDMAGLIVVDFIDMEVSGNNRKVEKALKEALKVDRARVQVGRISAFGLLEMSRQRLRTGVLEASTEPCPHCGGTGLVRTEGSAALASLRLIEEEAVKGRASHFRLRADPAVAIYILNRKRTELAELESRYGIMIEIAPDEELTGARVAIDSSGPPPAHAPSHGRLPAPVRHEELEEEGEEETADGEDESREEEGRSATRDAAGTDGSGDDRRGKRKRRRRGGRNRRNRTDEGAESPAPVDAGGEAPADGMEAAIGSDMTEPAAPEDGLTAGPETDVVAQATEEAPRPRTRRGRGRPAIPAAATSVADAAGGAAAPGERDRSAPVPAGVEPPAAEAAPTTPEGGAKAPRTRRPRAAKPTAGSEAEAGTLADAPAQAAEPAPVPAEPSAQEAAAASPAPSGETVAASAEAEPAPAPRRGWWQRTFGN